MPLIDLKTNLKSLRYGNDRPGGGNSGQPYIQTDINNPSETVSNIDDGLIRGGIEGTAKSSFKDLLRIGKFLTDAPKGPLFISKQVGLQLSNPKLEVLPGDSFLSKLGPTRIYNLGINTLAQIPVNALGEHIVRHGLTPVHDDKTDYVKVVKYNNLGTAYVGDGLPQKSTNRLIQKTIDLIGKPNLNVEESYIGGPNSVYGIGTTSIRRYDFTKSFPEGQNDKNNPFKVTSNKLNFTGSLGLSNLYFGNSSLESNNITPENFKINDSPNVVDYGTADTVVKKYDILKKKINNLTSGSIFNLSGNISGSISSYKNSLKNVVYENGYGETIQLKGSWSDLNREKRIGSGRKDSINLTPLFSAGVGSIDDSAPMYIPGADVQTINDLAKFRIQAINGDNPSANSIWMIFRAYLTQFSDSVNSNWIDIKYSGRGENFYIYNGFVRRIQIGFKVAALSDIEMKPMYQKLNYLMSNLMPDYKDNLMRGPLVRMTVGNWIDGQLGILNDLSYNIPNEAPWEISINKVKDPSTGTLYEPLILPHVVEVSMTFTPIGSQTQDQNLISKKSSYTSNIAQNYNGKNKGEANYIKSGIISGIKPEVIVPAPITTDKNFQPK